MSDWRREYAVWARTSAHQRRVEAASEVFRRAAAVGRVVVSSSWGKDSTALCDLAIETLGRIDIMHLASPYGLPGGEHVAEHFASRAQVHVVQASRSLAEYIEWCRDVGLPHERLPNAQAKAVRSLKIDRAATWAEEQGFAVRVLGMRADESANRRRLYRRRGQLYELATGGWMAAPIAWWTTADTWARIVSRDLPYHRLYDCETHGITRATNRNTGWLSTDGAHEGRIAWLRAHFPEQYRMLAAEFPQVRLLA